MDSDIGLRSLKKIIKIILIKTTDRTIEKWDDVKKDSLPCLQISKLDHGSLL